MARLITYEFPLNEKIRTLLRLEDAFTKYFQFVDGASPNEHQAAVAVLFEIAELGVRTDIKVDLLQELERQKQVLLGFKDCPDVQVKVLNQALLEIESASNGLLALPGKVGQHIRDNDWLTLIRNRNAIPGGACQFDIPAYHYWLNCPESERRKTLKQWIQPITPVNNALAIVLRLLRESGHVRDVVTPNGIFQTSLTNQTAQMIRIFLKESLRPIVPEVSANKYAINIRFQEAAVNTRPVRLSSELAFQISFCSL